MKSQTPLFDLIDNLSEAEILIVFLIVILFVLMIRFVIKLQVEHAELSKQLKELQEENKNLNDPNSLRKICKN